jgi:hypothetical protein
MQIDNEAVDSLIEAVESITREASKVARKPGTHLDLIALIERRRQVVRDWATALIEDRRPG